VAFGGTVTVLSHTTPIGAGSLALSGTIPAMVSAGTIAPDSAALALTGYAPSLITAFVISPSTGALVLTGHTPFNGEGAGMVPDGAELTLTGLAPTLRFDFVFSPGPAVLQVSGLGVTARNVRHVGQTPIRGRYNRSTALIGTVSD
jgi:hypothetical protein